MFESEPAVGNVPAQLANGPTVVATAQDHENARIRQAIAVRQAAEYATALTLAHRALGSGWKPWMKLVLLDSDYHDGRSTEPAATVYKVYRGEEKLSENSAYVSQGPDGTVRKANRYEELFGGQLHEPHSTRGFESNGTWTPYPRYCVCWSALELYNPKSAEQLANLRASRERGKTERERRSWAEENPLFTGLEPDG